MLVAAHTLGCKLNFAETSAIMQRFADAGHTVVDFRERADLYIINTCTVTATAERKCRTAIHQATSLAPEAKIAVIGCFAQNDAERIAKIPGVAYIVGNDRKANLLDIVSAGETTTIGIMPEPRSFEPTFSAGDRTRVFFKIQDGCDYYCTYCAIPFARGHSRSATIESTLATAKRIAATGAHEVVLTGVNTGTFGQQHGEKLIDLLRALDEMGEIPRFRISSIEPNLLTDEMIDFVASSRSFLPHFHIPLQAGSDKVLRLMHRRYTTADFAQKVDYIRHAMPHACIAADVMAGFNGETEEEFDHVCQFIESLPLSYLHVFTYSERPRTAALRMAEKIPVAMRREHSARLHHISEKKRKAFIDAQIGSTRSVLWEATNQHGYMLGWTDNYIRVKQPFDAAAINTIDHIRLDTNTIVDNFSVEN